MVSSVRNRIDYLISLVVYVWHCIAEFRDDSFVVTLTYATEEEADVAYINHVRDGSTRVAAQLAGDIAHQIEKYGPQRLNDVGWIAVIAEEFGEATRACLQNDLDEAIKESKQAAACCIRLCIELERRQLGQDVTEADRYLPRPL